MPSLLLHVDNLKCGGCASTVRHRILELPGATAVNVDPEAGTVRVEHDGSIEHDAVTMLLSRLGYPEHGTGGWKEKATSYLSCAIGRLHGED
jgi:copper chaperone